MKITGEIATILVAIITAISAIIVAVINNNYKKKEKQIKELHHMTSENFIMELKFFNKLKNHVERIFDNTKASRFLILYATNGKTDFRFSTVIYEQHKKDDMAYLSFGAVSKYVKFQFDEHYLHMLKDAEKNGCVRLRTSELPQSDLKSIYLSENITDSMLYFINRIHKDEHNDIIFFCTVGTHTGFLSDEEIIIVKSAIDSIKFESNSITYNT